MIDEYTQSHKVSQLIEENEQLIGENKQLKKKVDTQKKQFKEELVHVKSLKRQIKEMQTKMHNIPDHDSFQQEMEQTLKTKFDRIKSSHEQLIKQLRFDKEQLQHKNKDLENQLQEFQGEIKEALKLHKSTQSIKLKNEGLQKDLDKATNENGILQESLDQQQEKLTALQQQVIHLESENDKLTQIRQLEHQQKQI